ncbi:UNVERIFIED_CONTAM: hypothetical protein GTU68_060601 [Idotea baltica]|nr:hypothetical protein [Idotea baltica]
MPDGREVHLFTLTNAQGCIAKITNYGGIVTELHVPDASEELADVVWGFDSLEPYLGHHPKFGAIVGRFGNRIANGKFQLDGKSYELAINNGPNHLHGGLEGFDKKLWAAEAFKDESGETLELTYTSLDGEESYPGNLTMKITYVLTSSNGLLIDYEATTDAPTVLNLTNHSYFNLSGKGDILDHQLKLYADYFTPVDESVIPTGEIRSVLNSPMDFTKSTPIGARINDPDEQLKIGAGYDHNWVLNHTVGELDLAAEVFDPKSGRLMEVYTTEPGIQFYTANHLDGRIGKYGVVYAPRTALCLEVQHYPDSPNQPQFPTTVLRPEEVYKQTTIYRFLTT